MYIKRSIENVIKSRAKNGKCLLLTGPRQVGKSTLLKELYKDVKYYTFDDKILLAAEEGDPMLFMKNISIPAIIDEVQYAEKLFPYIKIECDKENVYEKFYLIGSQQMKLVAKAKESLAGIIRILELQGLSLRELHGIDFNKHFVPTDEYIKAREKN